MGKATGFLEYERNDNLRIPAIERIKNYNEFYRYLNEDERRKQAARCMDCGVPMCQSALKLKGMVTGCPLHNLIPEWNDEICNNHIEHGISRLLKTNNFPEFTGRVCPALCEKACICGLDSESVTVHENELYLIESAFSLGYIKPVVPVVRSGKKVAVIGSGPAGLAVSDMLNKRGHSVTVFERDDRIGGLLMYGIPNMKLDKSVIERRQKLMEAEGVVFKTSVDVGRDISAEEILNNYDAVVLCCGAKSPRSLAACDPAKSKDILYAVDYLKATTKSLLEKTENPISAKGKNVVIVGGGDTGNDCVGTCIRQGAASVIQLEMMPEPPEERTSDNPWPEWPLVKKTDYGQQEAIAVFGKDPRVYETTVKEAVFKGKKLTAVNTVKVRFEGRKPVEIEGTEETIPCDLLLIAAGFTGCESYVPESFSVKTGSRNTVETQESKYSTNINKVFTAGDMHRGQSLVVWAIAEGRACAAEIDEFLMGYSNM